MIIRECEYLSKIKWKVLIVDEGHRLKNKNGKSNNLSIHQIL